ncbi:uncharacterized protein LOC135712143 [Ochlerotatus camptorhynchus]|uniref:uncharacterized protein LOC135712143 n=1 Tax=Ochlerotatus camptorhynchus TaxID=644619 RepID=UPI0031CF9A81
MHQTKTLQIVVLGILLLGQCLSWESISNSSRTEIPSIQTTLSLVDDSSTTNVLSRRKRYVVFPEGSSFSVAVCMTIGVYGNPNYSMFSWALNWGIAYNLPNQTMSFENEMMEPKPMAQRRHRRDLYYKLEVAMNDMGYNGRECVLRALCESSQFFGKKGSNMVAEMLRTLFSFPKSKVLSFEHSDTRIYDEAHRKGRNKVMCQSLYPTCAFSLLELALGKYASPFSFISLTKVLSRRKRFLVFPEGASFSVAACMSVGIYGNPNYNMFSWAVNWGIAYNLPNNTISFHMDSAEPKAPAQRRHRRELYYKLEVAMKDMGYNGRECVLRALCESSQFFGKKGSNMASEMLRTLFSFPKSKVLSFEHSDTRIYDEAHRKGRNHIMCQSLYPTCEFSLLELALGKYSSPYNFM